VLETDRLILRRFTPDDAAFVYVLYNEPSFLRYIGDRGVHDMETARAYITSGPLASYERHGFGLYVVERKDGGDRIGVCGLLKRDTLDAPDLGFAFLPAYWSRGYAFEAASAVVTYARSALGLSRILAITSPGNGASIALLGKLGFVFEGTASPPTGNGAAADPVHLFRHETPQA
jgi:RimJ/RimL family protein N-acetyltransferase